MILTPQELEEAKRAAIVLIAAEIRELLDPEDLQTVELADVARYLGLTSKHAATLLPVIGVGPRTHRVSLKAFRAFKELQTTWPDEDKLRKYLAKYGKPQLFGL